MKPRDVPARLAELARINGAFLTSESARAALRETSGIGLRSNTLRRRELTAAPASVRAYVDLSPSSLALAGIRPVSRAAPHLNLLLDEILAGGVFAGVHTAVTIGRDLAGRLGMPLRVIMLNPTSRGNSAARATRVLRAQLGLDVTVVPREGILAVEFSADDYWLATHSKTAHAAHVATVAGVIDPTRVVYLIQDYEPGFSPWSSESVSASATYHAGFLPLVNSRPLAEYLRAAEGIEVDPAHVFGPQFDEPALRRTADARRSDGPLRVLFYARPSKPRNLFDLGVASLRSAASTLTTAGLAVEFLSVGERHRALELVPGVTLRSLGRLAWQEYFDLLSSVTVVLSLQQSPHPSHPPLDAAISGAIGVTNAFDHGRESMHPRVLAVTAEPEALGAAVATSVTAARSAGPGGYLPVADGVLGGTLDAALDAVVARLRAV